jgi:integrase
LLAGLFQSPTKFIIGNLIRIDMDDAANDQLSSWVKAAVSNLVRYEPSGVYFARAKVGGKLIRQSLKTDLLSIAKPRLQDLLAGEQKQPERRRTITVGKMTFGDALEIYKRRVTEDAETKPSTKQYQTEILEAVQKSWPEINSLDVKKINHSECTNWRSRFGAEYSATRVNGAISMLRRTFQIAVDSGIRHDNPMQTVRRAKVRNKQLTLPEAGQFLAFVKELETSGTRHSRPCANLVRFLAYGGFRKTEAASITWADCDFAKGKIVARGDPETGTKNSEIREVPMIPDMVQLLDQLRAERPNNSPQTPVMRVRECQKAMDRAAKIVGVHRITHHDLRHLFATRCIESGVDIPTVSRWLGHKDGGALAMKVYGHLRDQHSVAMAQKVTFSKSQPDNVVQMPGRTPASAPA